MGKKGGSKKAEAPSDKDLVSKKAGKKGKKNNQEEEPEELTQAQKQKLKRQENLSKVTSTGSWTGKLPHALLHEKCQKNKWGKVEYDMINTGKGFISFAILQHTVNNEKLTCKMTDPIYGFTNGDESCSVPQETPLEARNLAATIALYRISYNTNLKMLLPPNVHRQTWERLEDFRKTLVKDNNKSSCDYFFDIDPFKSLIEQRKIQAQKEKERKARIEQEKKEKIQPMVVMDSLGATADTHQNTKNNHFNEKTRKINNLAAEIFEVDNLVSFPTKVWEKSPVIDFSDKKRLDLERVLQPLYYETITKRKLPTIERLVHEKELLMELGFKETHVLESLQYPDPLSFLIFLTPSQDLPSFFYKKREDSKSTITVRTLEHSKQLKVERLMELGILEEESAQYLKINDWDEAKACSYITKRAIDPPLEDMIDEADFETMGTSEEIWNMEIESLKSIYENDVELINETTCLFTLNPQLKMKVYKTEYYPFEMPGVIISTFDKKYHLPTFTKKEIMNKLVSHVKELGIMGGMMLYEIFDFISQNINEIIKNPSPLLDQIKNKNGLKNRDGLSGRLDMKKVSNGNQVNKKKRNYNALSKDQINSLKQEYSERYKTIEYQAFKTYRMNLPVSQKRDELLKLINDNQKTLITAGTGCGKSTQVPQFMLEDLIEKEDFNRRIIVTQPRRIAAIGLAERVADERCSKLGEEVGYVIRGVNKTSNKTRLTFMTTGILVRMLQGDLDDLKNTTIVIDEVHERSIDTDLIIVLLKKIMKKSGLKIVLMSATVDEKQYKDFFDNDLGTIYIEGRTFPVTDYYLEDVIEMVNFQNTPSLNNNNKNKKATKAKIQNRSNFSKSTVAYDDIDEDDYFSSLNESGENDNNESTSSLAKYDAHFFKSGQISYDLITETVAYINDQLVQEGNDGSIIVFLPGVGEIDSCCRNLRSLGSYYEILPLHSALTPDDQKKVFNSYKNKRKVVVSTNIAETSITIDDVVATIDSGRAKTVFYSAKDNTTRLLEGWISKAESKQRRGRAGRVRAGKCYKLFSTETYTEMQDYPIPEIKRVGLQDLYLNIKAMNISDVIGFLKESMDAPSVANVKKAERHLKEKGLINEENELTKMGKYISLLPGSDTDGKILINSILFRCLDTGILMASIIGLATLPFVGGMENRDKIKSLIKENRGDTYGDLIATLKIVQGYYESSQKSSYMRENCLSFMKLKEISSSVAQFKSWLRDLGFIPFDYKSGDLKFNKNSNNFNILKSILTGALYPNIARVQYPDTKYAMTASGAVEKDLDASTVKYWSRNEEYMEHIYANQGKPREEQVTMTKKGTLIDNTINKPLPAVPSFIHPSSTLHERRNAPVEIDPETGRASKKSYKPNFVLYSSSSESIFQDFKGKDYAKLFLREIEPTSTVSVLLFGGIFNYDLNLSNKISGIVVDNWMPIRTWCKNGVLLKELKYMLDEATHLILSSPKYSSSDVTNPDVERAFRILNIVEKVLDNERYY